jgi:hypothetical protein
MMTVRYNKEVISRGFSDTLIVGFITKNRRIKYCYCYEYCFLFISSEMQNDIKQRLKSFIDKPASNHLLAHIAHQASLVIPCHHTNDYKSPIPPLPTFVNLLARRSSARTGTLLASLVLLDRLRQRLAQFARGMPCTCQRIFLATLIVTTKVLHDTSPKNKHWTKYAVYFTLAEINLMEKQLLALMVRFFICSYSLLITYNRTTN